MPAMLGSAERQQKTADYHIISLAYLRMSGHRITAKVITQLI